MLRRMFGMGMGEIVVLAIVALLCLGPDKLPDAAKKLSKGIRDLRKHTRGIQDTIENDTGELGGAVRDLKSALRGEPEPYVPKHLRDGARKAASQESGAGEALAGEPGGALTDGADDANRAPVEAEASPPVVTAAASASEQDDGLPQITPASGAIASGTLDEANGEEVSQSGSGSAAGSSVGSPATDPDVDANTLEHKTETGLGGG